VPDELSSVDADSVVFQIDGRGQVMAVECPVVVAAKREDAWCPNPHCWHDLDEVGLVLMCVAKRRHDEA
jgi:hypothetical protein